MKILSYNSQIEHIFNHQNTLAVNWILEKQVVIKPKMKKDEIILCKYFKKKMGFFPRFIYSSSVYYGILFFLSKKIYEILHKNHLKEISYLRKNMKRKIHFICVPNSFRDLIENLFKHVKILDITCLLDKQTDDIDDVNNLVDMGNTQINFYILLEDHQIPFGLGAKGGYIHLVNQFLKDYIGNYTIYLRGLL